jgi:opacity protein-like surface antigen
MRKLVFVCLISFSFMLSSNAQKKFFFESVEINNLIYFDDIRYDKEEWLKQFKSLSHPSAQRLDSFFTGDSRHWNWNRFKINRGIAFQIRVEKRIPVFKEVSRSLLTWKTGFGYKTFRMRSDDFWNSSPYSDTTKPYFVQQQNFKLLQDLCDIYNAIIYDYHSGWFHGYIGSGFLTSFSMSSRLKENYILWQKDWNSSSHTWNQNKIDDEINLIPAKSTINFAWTIPFGVSIDATTNVLIDGGFEYFNQRRSPRLTEKKNSEGLILQLAIRYKL